MSAAPLLRRRWLIGVLLFLATVLNYVDRQVFSILAPDLQQDIGWSELDYSRIVNAFQLAYALALLAAGGVLDRVGAKVGLAWSMVLWTLAAAGHALAHTPLGFGLARGKPFRDRLEPRGKVRRLRHTEREARERALATGLFNSGVALGIVLASIGVPLLSAAYGWRATFVATAVLGLCWLPFWLAIYRDSPLAGARAAAAMPHERAPRWRELLRLRQTWAYALTKSLGDPIWWFYLFWLPKYLAAAFDVRGTAVIPYLTAVYVAADVGCLGAGWLSSALIKRGVGLNAARKGTMALLVCIMTPTVIVAGTLHDPRLAIALIAIACGAHQAWSTMVFTMATDLFPSSMVGSVSGFGGFVAGLVSIAAAESIGRVLDADATLYLPIFVAAGLIYPLALGVFHLLSPRMEPVPQTIRSDS